MPRDRRLLTILAVVGVQMVGASMILPILPLYAKNEFGLSPQAVTVLAASFFAAQFVAGPYLGRLSDRVGRVPVLIVSQIGTAVSFALIAVAPDATWLFVARILDGITGGNIVVAQAYITDVTPPEKRAQALGLVFAMFGAAFVVGPALGGLLSGLGLQVPYLVAAVAAIGAVVLTWLTLDESLSAEEREARRAARERLTGRMVLASPPLLITLLLGFLAMFVLGLVVSTFALVGEAYVFENDDPARLNLSIGLLLTVVGVAQVVTQTRLLGPILDRLGEARSAIVGTIARSVGLVVGFATPLWPLVALGSALFAFGGGVNQPPIQAIATRSLPDRFRGGVLGLYQSVASVGTILSTALGGFLFARQVLLPMWVAAGLSLAAAVPTALLIRRPAEAPDVTA
jgi:DHA1 family tetracycline resistance protein-like MFS transporter